MINFISQCEECKRGFLGPYLKEFEGRKLCAKCYKKLNQEENGRKHPVEDSLV